MIKVLTICLLAGACLGQANGSTVSMTAEQQKILAQLLGPGVSSLSNGMYQIPVSGGQNSVSQGGVSQGGILQGGISQGGISQGGISQGVNGSRPSTNVQLQDTSLVFTHTGSQPPNTNNLTQAQVRNLLLGLPVDGAQNSVTQTQNSVVQNQSSVNQGQSSLADLVASLRGNGQNMGQSLGNSVAIGTIIPGKTNSNSVALGSRMNSLQRQNLLALLGDPSTAPGSARPQVMDQRLRLFLEAKAKGEIPKSNIFQTGASTFQTQSQNLAQTQTQSKEQIELLKLIELMRKPSNDLPSGQMPYISDASSTTSLTSTTISGSPSLSGVTSTFPPASSLSSGFSSASTVSSNSQNASSFPAASGVPPGFPPISALPSTFIAPSGSMSVSNVSSSSNIPSGFPSVSTIPSGMGGFSQTGSVTETTQLSSAEIPGSAKASGGFGSEVQTSSSTVSQEDLIKLFGAQIAGSGNGSAQGTTVASLPSFPVPIPGLKSENSSSSFSSQSVQQTPLVTPSESSVSTSTISTTGSAPSVDMASELARLQAAGINVDFSAFQKLFTPTTFAGQSQAKA